MQTKTTYTVQNEETGLVIATFSTLEEAEMALEAYENEDKKNGEFLPNFYEIKIKETQTHYIITLSNESFKEKWNDSEQKFVPHRDGTEFTNYDTLEEAEIAFNSILKNKADHTKGIGVCNITIVEVTEVYEGNYVNDLYFVEGSERTVKTEE